MNEYWFIDMREKFGCRSCPDFLSFTGRVLLGCVCRGDAQNYVNQTESQDVLPYIEKLYNVQCCNAIVCSLYSVFRRSFCRKRSGG